MMTLYQGALLIHLFALLAAVGAASLVWFVSARRARAVNLGQALEWERTLSVVERVFPIALIVLVATGAWMIRLSGTWSWSLGWIDGGLTGVVILFAGGITIGARGRKHLGELEARAAREGVESGAVPSVDPVAHLLSHTNTMTALAVVCMMTLKPSLPGSLALLVAGFACGIAITLRERARRASGVSSAAELPQVVIQMLVH